MKEEKITIEFKYPWSMMPMEKADEWINAVKKTLNKDDPLCGKDIFVSGRHEYEELILVDNDTDNNYAIVSISKDNMNNKVSCKTTDLITSRKALAKRLQNDHEEAVNKFKKG